MKRSVFNSDVLLLGRQKMMCESEDAIYAKLYK